VAGKGIRHSRFCWAAEKKKRCDSKSERRKGKKGLGEEGNSEEWIRGEFVAVAKREEGGRRKRKIGHHQAERGA